LLRCWLWLLRLHPFEVRMRNWKYHLSNIVPVLFRTTLRYPDRTVTARWVQFRDKVLWSKWTESV
jgi:hypothetical protein